MLAACLAATSPALFAQAQDGMLRMVVPFGAGTTTDIVSRVVGEGLAKALEQHALRAEELVAFNRAELDKWTQLVKRSGAQVY